MEKILFDFFSGLGFTDFYATLSRTVVLLLAVALLSLAVHLIVNKFLLSLIAKIATRTRTVWDDILVQKGVFTRLARIAPALVVYFLLPLIFRDSEIAESLIHRVVLSYLIVIIITVINSLITAVNAIYSNYEISKNHPIKGYLQIIRVFISIMGIALVVTTVLNKSALGLLSGIGALSAVLMLVFKDSILGLVAAVQLSGNDMIRIGDWISVPDYGADGDVVDIKLQTVTIQNFDKTIVSVPIYSLISSSFKNWRGMSDSGGRRIKRHINIDMNSVKFCSEDMLDRFRDVDILREYITTRQVEIDKYNSLKKINTTKMINGRRMTNLGVFRVYIAAYLQTQPHIDEGMTFLVRQLQPSDKGIPIEIYVFSSDQIWSNYENIQADIFDHILASISFFDLAVYQTPSSLDLSKLLKKRNNLFE